jgi:hypothetical protein
VAAPVGRITTAQGEALGLQFVQEQHQVVGIDAEHLTELLLGDGGVLAQMGEYHELLHPHPEEVLGRPAVDDP